MWNKIKNYLIILLIMLTTASIYFNYRSYSKETKLGYIDIQGVFNEFNMKKDMQKKLVMGTSGIKARLDSMRLGLQAEKARLDAMKNPPKEDVGIFYQKREEYYMGSKNFENMKDSLTKQYDKQILGQLNQYVQEYGKANGYTYIFGSDQNGSIMYAGQGEDLTAEVIKYLNSKYAGN